MAPCSSKHLLTHFLILALSALIFIQFSVSNWKSRKYASFFFEHATPETLAPRNNKIDLKHIPNVQKAISDLNHIIIDRYITWHYSVVSRVRSGELDGSSVRTLVFVGNEGRHGLGDRLRGILFAYMAAVLSDRVLLIKWEDPFPLSTVLVNSGRSNFTFDESLFPSPLKSDGEPDAAVVDSATLKDMHLFTGEQATILLLCEPRPSFDDLFKAVRKCPNLTTSVEMKKVLPLKRRPQAQQFFPLIFKALVKPSAELRKMMTETIDRHNRFAPSRLWKEGPLRRIDTSEPFVSIHARLGYGVGEYIKRFKAEMTGRSLDSVAQCMAGKAMLLAKREGITSPPRFYLATDTAEFRLKLKRALKRIDSRTKVMYGTWGMKHVKNMNEKTAEDLELFRYTFMDIYIMSKGRSILRSRSGFPNLAIWMGGIPSDMGFSINKDCEHVS